MSHTPEPWAQDKRFSLVVTSPTRNVCSVSHQDNSKPDGGHGENIANVRRIVAAVNACAGIPTEALEADVVRRMWEWINHALHNASGPLANKGRALLKELNQ